MSINDECFSDVGGGLQGSSVPRSILSLALYKFQYFLTYCLDVCLQCLDTVVGRQEEHPACKKLSDEVLVWLSVWNEVQIVCILSS